MREVRAGAPRRAAFLEIADEAPALLWQARGEAGRDFFNRAWCSFTGRSLAEAAGDGWLQAVHPEDLASCLPVCRAARAARRPFVLEYRLRRHDGSWRWVRDSGQPMQRGGSFAGACTDISEQRRAAEERDRLLAELQHRVRNNAQATAAFLGLQANRAVAPEVAGALRGAARRVMLATLVQDRMFRAAAEAAIPLGPELAMSARTALAMAARADLHLALGLTDGMVLPVARAMPLALIVSELVANAAHHAFPPGRPGQVRLVLREAAPGLGELEVADDGIGLPPARPRWTEEGCLGLHLVRRLARQARASFRLETRGGTRATLRFGWP